MSDDYEKFLDKPEEGEIGQLHSLVQYLQELEETEKEQAEALKNTSAKIKELKELTIPELMDSIGLEDFKSNTGLKVKVTERIFANTSPSKDPERHAEAMKWLEDNGHGDLIKRDIKVSFDLAQEESAVQLYDNLKENYPVAISRSVHASRLSSFIGSLLSEGEDVPLETFGVYRKRTVKITK